MLHGPLRRVNAVPGGEMEADPRTAEMVRAAEKQLGNCNTMAPEVGRWFNFSRTSFCQKLILSHIILPDYYTPF